MRCLILLLAPLIATGQSRIEGRVTNSASGSSVAKATVLLVRDLPSDDGERRYSAMSDADGKFAIEDVTAGEYRLLPSRTGFITIEYGAKRPERKGTVLKFAGAQEVKDVEVRLVPQGVLTGRVLDADGDPVERAKIELLRQQYVDGKKTLSTLRPVFTNDLGEYRAAGLVAGKYWLYAEWPDGPISGATEQYVPSYYVSATDAAAAVPIDVGAGTQTRAGEILLRKARTTTVKGRVAVRVAGASERPTVTAYRTVGHNNRAASYFRSLPATVNAAGEFELRDMTPGSYTLTAAIAKGGIWVPSAPATVEVGGSKIEGVLLEIDDFLTVTGKLRVEDDAKMEASPIVVRLRRGQGNDRGRVDDDRTFRMRNVARGRYDVVVDGLPAGFYVKSVRAGEADVTYAGLDLGGGAPPTLDILVSPKGGTVTGTVADAEGKPAAGATVVLAPKEKDRRYPQLGSDQFGRFKFTGVVPGEYTVYAWDDVEFTAWMDAEFLKDAKGEAVTVGERASATVAVKVAK
jgi:hypothetical protein